MEDYVTVYQGDCLEVMKNLPAESVDAVVTDPPAGIAFMGKEWDHSRGGRRKWSEWLSDRLREALRVAKPGAHMLCWALPRTSHWTACAIEDAGWIIEDRVAHIFGTGFPKHKSKLKPAVEDWWVASKPGGEKWLGVDACRVEGAYPSVSKPENGITSFGCMNDDSWTPSQSDFPANSAGRWPANLVLSHHPECKPNGVKKVKANPTRPNSRGISYTGNYKGRDDYKTIDYVDADGTETVQAFDCHPECPARILDEQSGESKSQISDNLNGWRTSHHEGWKRKAHESYGKISGGYDDSGGASRFFPGFLYCPKASRNDRGEGNIHPTVKAEPLMRWLLKLVTPPGGTVLDPFAGSGSTGFAAEAEGFHAILIEQNPEYVKIIQCRMTSIQDQTPLFK